MLLRQCTNLTTFNDTASTCLLKMARIIHHTSYLRVQLTTNDNTTNSGNNAYKKRKKGGKRGEEKGRKRKGKGRKERGELEFFSRLSRRQLSTAAEAQPELLFFLATPLGTGMLIADSFPRQNVGICTFRLVFK